MAPWVNAARLVVVVVLIIGFHTNIIELLNVNIKMK